MTPNDYEKQLTTILSECLSVIGFKKKRCGVLLCKKGDCEQRFNFTISRDRGLPGNLYTFFGTMMISYQNVNKLTDYFIGIPYDKNRGTIAQPFYTVLPLKYEEYQKRSKYCADESIERFANQMAEDIISYSPAFYDRYDTLEKLTSSIVDYQPQNPMYIVRTIDSRQSGIDCCRAASMCLMRWWEDVENLLSVSKRLTNDQRERIREYISREKSDATGEIV